MGYSLLFTQGWTWGNLIGEAVSGLLFAFLLVMGKRYVQNIAQTKVMARFAMAGLVFFGVLICSLTSLGITELYRRSSGAPILTPVFGIFYAFVVGSYTVAGIIIAAQLVGSLVGYALAVALRPRIKNAFKVDEKEPVEWKKVAIKGILTLVLLCGVGFITLINPTSYGGTAVVKILIMSFVFFGAFLVFGDLEFYSYTSLYTFFEETAKVYLLPEMVRIRSLSSQRAKMPEPGMFLLANRHLHALLFQFLALGLMIGIYSLMQSLPGSISISRVI